MAIKFLNTVQVDTDVLYVDAANDRVGIGTASPLASLDVASTTNDYVAKFSHSTATGYAPGSILLQAGQGNSRGQGLYHYNTEADENWFTGVPYAVSSQKWIVANKYSTTQDVDTAQLTYALMTIASDTGNVGIGTASPSEKLEVSGSNTLSIKLSPNNTEATYVTTLTNNYSATLGTELKSGTYNILTHGNSTGTALNFTNGAMTFDFRNSERMRITEAGNVGINSTNPPSLLDVQPTSANRKVTRIANDVMSTYFYNTQADAILAWTCGSYYQAEVVITANQTNGGTTNNLYIRGIWSNNHTSHHWDELEHIGSLTGSTFTMSVGQNGSTAASGRLELDFNYLNASFSQLNVRVTDFYGSHSYTIT